MALLEQTSLGVLALLFGLTSSAQGQAPCGGIEAMPPGPGFSLKSYQTAGAGVHQITLAYDSSVEPWVRDYIDAYWIDLEPCLNTVVGPPSGTFTVNVVYEPNPGAGGTYSASTNTLKFSTLPQGYNTRFFNATFAHEMVHAYTDAALEMGWTSWCAEGIAVAATGIVKYCLNSNWPMDIGDRSLGSISAMYGHVSQNLPESLGGSGSLIRRVAPTRAYAAAGGVFWFLTVSQDPTTLAGAWSQYDYLAQLLGEIYGNGDGLTASECLDAIESTAPYLLDGTPTRVWVEQQPVTAPSVDNGLHVYASFTSPFLNSSQSTNLEYQVFSRSGSLSTPQFGQPVTIRAYDVSGDLVCTLQHTASSGGFGLPIVELCSNVNGVAGAYAVEIDASAYGAGSLTIAGANVGNNAGGFTADLGSGVVFFDTTTQRVVNRSFSLNYAVLSGTWSGAHLVTPTNQWLLPTIFRIGLNTWTPGGSPSFDRAMPLPFRRFTRLDVSGL